MESWEEALDVDDSDLPSFTLLPCSNRPPSNPNPNPNSSQSQTLPFSSQFQNPPELPNLNPNPHLSSSTSNPTSTTTRPLIPGPAGDVQAGMLRKNSQSPVGDDRNGHLFLDEDFNGNPWLCALDFLGLEAGSRLRLPHTIESTRNMERVPQIVGIVKSCTSNGLGDLIVTLKDPTGTIGASIHRKVLAESMSGKDISVGSVVILQQAVAFSSTRSSRYLNVTLNNVVKIVSKNSGLPQKRSFPAAKVLCSVLEKDVEIGQRISEMTSVGKGADGVSDGAFSRDRGRYEGMTSERRPEDAARSSHCNNTLHGKVSVVKEPFHETCGRSGVSKLVPRVSVADWTDEQLHELFADD